VKPVTNERRRVGRRQEAVGSQGETGGEWAGGREERRSEGVRSEETVGREERRSMDKPHKKLKVWQQGMDLAVAIYRETEAFPAAEQFGLTGQMRRASVSIVSNVAEGAARQSDADFARFLGNSLGSASELDTQLELCVRLNYLPATTHSKLDAALTAIDKMLIGLRSSVRRRDRRPEKPKRKTRRSEE
jgi:four helix bundle protein